VDRHLWLQDVPSSPPRTMPPAGPGSGRRGVV